ncbi:THO complex subunit 6-like [Curcuma longa]|uniref:THO complex subunit 6-like n=1 Tax=Curcuma longa TaxID=136217 RepID=UPI003D9EAAE3
MATEQEGTGGDARCWDEERYRKSILQERELRCRTVFRTAFAPSQNPNPEILVVASSDGSLSSYSLPSCIASMSQYQQLDMVTNQRTVADPLSADPLSIIQAHKGPTYDLKFYSHGENNLLFSCGDDGRLRGWNWKEILSSHIVVDKKTQGNLLKPILDLANPQHEGPWGALSPIPETNAITINEQEGSVYSAAGDARAYSWDIETGKQKMVFRGHTDYLHCISARKSSHQIITGSEDGTTRIWDCRSGLCTQIIQSGRNLKSKLSSWVSSVAIDSSESWLACGTGTGLSVWSLLSYECIFSIGHYAPVQDLLFDDNQIVAVGSEPVLTRFSINGATLSQLKCAPQSAFSVSLHPSGVIAVGGYGALVDVLSQFGSHLCTFYCMGLDNDS